MNNKFLSLTLLILGGHSLTVHAGLSGQQQTYNGHAGLIGLLKSTAGLVDTRIYAQPNVDTAALTNVLKDRRAKLDQMVLLFMGATPLYGSQSTLVTTIEKSLCEASDLFSMAIKSLEAPSASETSVQDILSQKLPACSESLRKLTTEFQQLSITMMPTEYYKLLEQLRLEWGGGGEAEGILSKMGKIEACFNSPNVKFSPELSSLHTDVMKLIENGKQLLQAEEQHKSSAPVAPVKRSWFKRKPAPAVAPARSPERQKLLDSSYKLCAFEKCIVDLVRATPKAHHSWLASLSSLLSK